jgi:poly(3-hydroxybutyrate) depolymerase
MRSSLAVRSLAALLVLGGAALTACGDSGDDDDGDGAGGSAAGQGGTSLAGSGGTAEGATSGSGTLGGAGGTAGANGGAPNGGKAGSTGNSGGSSTGGSSAGTGTAGDGAQGGSAGASAGSSGSDGAGTDAGGNGAGGSGGGTGGLDGADPSDGCNADDFPASGPYTFDVGGTEREYIVKLPADYDPTRPYRLIFAFHGRMYDAESVDSGGPPGSGPYYGIEAEAGGSAIFVAPQALSSSWTNEGDRDGAYFDAMLERFEGQYCVDRSRVFSVGFSMGAIMTITLGCSRSDVLRAIAPMSGSLPQSGMLPDGCAGDPLPYWSSHGLQDTTIRPEQGEAARDEFVAKNGCDDASMPTEPEGCVAYQGCDAGYPVTWCTFEGEHEPAPFAGAAIWQFLSQF